MKKAGRWSGLAALVFVLGGCAEATRGDVAGVEEAAFARVAAPNLVEVAVAVNGESGEFSTLIAALGAADLVGAIAAKGQRTVFAPTDAAFAKLGLDASNIGDAFTKEELAAILLYHVSPGRRYSGDVVSATRIRMLSGGFTAVSLREDGAYVNDSRIVAVDVEASNGIIHVIDSVLLP